MQAKTPLHSLHVSKEMVIMSLVMGYFLRQKEICGGVTPYSARVEKRQQFDSCPRD